MTGAVFGVSMGSTFIQQAPGGKHLGRRIFLPAPLRRGRVRRGVAEPEVVVRCRIVSAPRTLAAGLPPELGQSEERP